jgi:hypothetical protein
VVQERASFGAATKEGEKVDATVEEDGCVGRRLEVDESQRRQQAYRRR